MAKPLSVQEQIKQLWFIPHKTLLVLFSMTRFDAVLKTEGGGLGAGADATKPAAAYAPLPAAETDCDDLRACLAEYDITDEADIYRLADPTEMETRHVFEQLDLRLAHGRDSKPRVNYLVICLFAGHGVLKAGMQALIYNEYCKRTNFYRILYAESVIRGMADRYDNAYMIAIFACCRQLYNSKRMEGLDNDCMPGSKPHMLGGSHSVTPASR